MFAKIKDGAIEATGTLKQLFPNTSFPAGVADSDFKTANGLQDIINAEQKDRKYYYVTQGDVTLVDGVATQGFTNTAMAIEDVDAKDADGNQLYVQEWDADFDNGEGEELMLKTLMVSSCMCRSGMQMKAITEQWLIQARR